MNNFIKIYNDENENLIIECEGYIQEIEIKTPDDCEKFPGTENTYVVSKFNESILGSEIDEYFDKVWINGCYCTGGSDLYNGDEENILKYSNKFIPIGFLFSLYGSTDSLYSIQIEDLSLKPMDYLDVDFSFGYGTELTGYMWLNDELKLGGHDILNLITNKEKINIKIIKHSKKDIHLKFENKNRLKQHLKSCYGRYFNITEATLQYYEFE